MHGRLLIRGTRARARAACGFLLACLALGAMPAMATVVPGGMASHQTNATGSATAFEMTFTIESAPPDASNLYWAQQFYTSTTVDHGGYVGLQTGGNINGVLVGKIAIFSIWNADAAEAGPGATAQTFDGEGIGYSVRIPYAWKAGVGYRFRVEKDGALWWKATLVDTSTGSSTYIGRIRITQDVPLQPVWVAFTEYYTGLADCAAVPHARVAFSPISFAGGTWGSNTPITYGNCATNARATRRDDGTALHEIGLKELDFANAVASVITGYYQTILGRAPDQAGLDFWAGEATRVRGLGADVREVFFAMSMAFFASSEYVGRNTSDTQYLTDLYRTFFNRTPDASGLAYWQGELAASGSRSALLNSFLFSAEYSSQMTTLFGATSVRPEITMAIDLFRGAFGRLPDSTGFTYWLDRIRDAQCQGAAAVATEVNFIAGQFFNSGEYLARARSDRDFTGDVYNAYLRRGPGGDAAGFNYWTGQVATRGRDGVRAQFVPGAEFQGRVSAVVGAGCVP